MLGTAPRLAVGKLWLRLRCSSPGSKEVIFLIVRNLHPLRTFLYEIPHVSQRIPVSSGSFHVPVRAPQTPRGSAGLQPQGEGFVVVAAVL